jgi:hypothetical protein
MSLLYFEPSPRSRVGKSSGQVDLFYVLARVAMVVINMVTQKTVASILCTIILLSQAVFMGYQQPFYEPQLNNLRFGLFFSSVIVSICSIAGAYSDLQDVTYGNQVTYVIATLLLGFASIPAGYVLNGVYVKTSVKSIFLELKDELAFRLQQRLQNPEIHRSQLDLIYANVNDVLLSRAKDHEVMVYPSAGWAEVSARFIRESYLNDKAVTLVADVFDIAFEQYPKSAHLHLMYLEYIKEFIPQMAHFKRKHIAFLNKRCSYVFWFLSKCGLTFSW